MIVPGSKQNVKSTSLFLLARLFQNIVRAFLRPYFKQDSLLYHISQIKAQRLRRHTLAQGAVLAVGD
jgi:hypothetical protein